MNEPLHQQGLRDSTETRTRFCRVRTCRHTHRLSSQSGVDEVRTRSLLVDNQALSTGGATTPYAPVEAPSERQDSNLRPPTPEAGALTKLRYVPLTAMRPAARPEPESRIKLASAVYKTATLPLSYTGVAGDRGIEPRQAEFGAPPGPSPSPMSLEGKSRTSTVGL